MHLRGERRYTHVNLVKNPEILEKMKRKLTKLLSMTDMKDVVSLVPGMGVTRDRQERCPKPLPERCGMANGNPAYTPRVGQAFT